MGQVQSETSGSGTSSANDRGPTDRSTEEMPQGRSMDSLLAEAAAYGDDENESIDAKAQKALDCPCIAHLRTGPCGTQFSEAFLCFMKSTTEEKGSDCVNPFVALQSCIKENPGAFSKDVLEDDESEVEAKEVEEPKPPEYRISPPRWAMETDSPKHRL
ncbi:hypothetical protein MLD38_024275 [Melastoma candidum]|uniref:Uncharacterized protein n=1 Tax=Melastoma candidum TaxID=119954 RepID=A0ACB9NT35_9MYRT|nr:hypothetical protein MLD38_024275 [Melastoma candidum]